MWEALVLGSPKSPSPVGQIRNPEIGLGKNSPMAFFLTSFSKVEPLLFGSSLDSDIFCLPKRPLTRIFSKVFETLCTLALPYVSEPASIVGGPLPFVPNHL